MEKALAGKRVLITQATGFMGPALCEVFTAQGAAVVASTDDLVEADAAERVVRVAGEGYMLPSAAPGDVVRGVLSESFESSPIVLFSRACREELDGLHRRL